MKISSCGVLSAATGFGKIVVAAALIAERNINTLIIVHTKQLLTQWKESLQSFLKLDGNQVGQIGGGKKKPTGKVDIAMIQKLILFLDNIAFISPRQPRGITTESSIS